MANPNTKVSETFRALLENAEKKFARVSHTPLYTPSQNHNFHKVFKAYMRLWNFQRENRSKLVESGLNRWEIGEIASRIGQLYYNQYVRTSEGRFVIEAFVFYEAILRRKYFEGRKGVGVRFKELRFYARFLMVCLILKRWDLVEEVVERFKEVVEDSKVTFKETNFKEWKLVVQEIVRFTEVESAFTYTRPLRYCVMLDSHPASRPYVARFHARKVLKFRDAILTSYHRNEVKFAELTLDTYRMLQSLEWEPSGSFYQKRPADYYQKHPLEPKENGNVVDHSAASGLIDINLSADFTDPSLPPNPRKAILYRPSVTHLLAVMATICDELPVESVMLLYISSTGKIARSNVSQTDSSGGSRKSSKHKAFSGASSELTASSESHSNGKIDSNDYGDNYLLLGPRGNDGSSCLYTGDIIPFTRKPLFLIIDSDNSNAFKVLHGAERGEPAALLLSPLRPVFRNLSGVSTSHNGSQFTFFLTAPLQAFCQMVGLTSSESDTDLYERAEEIISSAFSEWEVILCTSRSLDIVWAQVLSDPFLRRIMLRFLFCRAVLSLFCSSEDSEQYLPVCLPDFPCSVAPRSTPVHSAILRLARHLNVADYFHFNDT